MTKDEAKQSLAMLSCGILGTLTGVSRYDQLDELLNAKLNAVDHVDVSECKTWQDVWEKVR